MRSGCVQMRSALTPGLQVWIQATKSSPGVRGGGGSGQKTELPERELANSGTVPYPRRQFSCNTIVTFKLEHSKALGLVHRSTLSRVREVFFLISIFHVMCMSKRVSRGAKSGRAIALSTDFKRTEHDPLLHICTDRCTSCTSDHTAL